MTAVAENALDFAVADVAKFRPLDLAYLERLDIVDGKDEADPDQLTFFEG